MEKIEAELAVLHARAETLRNRHAAAEAAFVDADAKLQHHLLEADLDADEKLRTKLEAGVANCALTRDNFAKALAAQQVKVANAEQQLAVERAAVERKAASEKLSRDLDAFEKVLPLYVDISRRFTAALEPIEHWHFETSEMSRFIGNCASQVEVASAFSLRELHSMVNAIANGSAPIPAKKPAPAMPVAPVEPAPETQRVFMMKSAKYLDHAGRERQAPQYEDADLPIEAAQRALRYGIATLIDDPRRRDLHGVKGGRVNANAIDVVDLTSEEGARPPHMDPILASVKFEQIDRSSEARTIKFPVVRV